VAHGPPFHIKPATVSKLNTASQIVLAATVLSDDAFGLKLEMIREVLIWTTGVLTFLSLGAYVRTWVHHMTGYGTPPK
jgi:cardiolipin synthase